MSDFKWVEDMVVTKLSNKGLMLCSRFAREVKNVDGTVLLLQDPKLPKTIVEAVRRTDNPKLWAIFSELLVEFKLTAKVAPSNVYRGADAREVDNSARVYRGVAQ